MDVNDRVFAFGDREAELVEARQACQNSIKASALLKHEQDENRAEMECAKSNPFFAKIGWAVASAGVAIFPVGILLALPVPITALAGLAIVTGGKMAVESDNIHRNIYLDRLSRRLKFLKIPKEDIDQTIESIRSGKRNVLEGKRISGLISERRNEILGVTLPSQNETPARGNPSIRIVPRPDPRSPGPDNANAVPAEPRKVAVGYSR